MRENSPLESECGSRALKIPGDIRKSNYYHDFRNIVDPDKDLVHINQPEQKHQLPFVFFCYITYCNVTSFPCKTSTTCTRIWSMSISTSTSIHTRRRRAFVVVIFAQITSESYKTFIQYVWYDMLRITCQVHKSIWNYRPYRHKSRVYTGMTYTRLNYAGTTIL